MFFCAQLGVNCDSLLDVVLMFCVMVLFGCNVGVCVFTFLFRRL